MARPRRNEPVAHSAPDGYTLLFATSARHVTAAQLISRLPYAALRDFTPVINAAYATSVIVVNAALPVHSLGDLIDCARARHGKLNYASSGTGSANHLDTELFALSADVRAAIVARLNRTVDAILEQPATRAWMDRKGFEIAGGSAQEFARILSVDDAKWRDALRRIGIRPE